MLSYVLSMIVCGLIYDADRRSHPRDERSRFLLACFVAVVVLFVVASVYSIVGSH